VSGFCLLTLISAAVKNPAGASESFERGWERIPAERSMGELWTMFLTFRLSFTRIINQPRSRHLSRELWRRMEFSR
jgi:hypothetical protein